MPHAAGLDGRGGSSYIDSVILRTTYTGTGGSVVEDKRFYYAQNWRADVSVVLDDSGVQQERIGYSPYGQPYGIAAGDTDFDGDHDATDDTAIGAWSAAYRAYADVNLDGSINSSDATAASEHALGWNVLTSDDVDNKLGRAGSIQDGIGQFQHGRSSVYSSLLGRPLQPGAGDGAGVAEDECGGMAGDFPPDPCFWRRMCMNKIANAVTECLSGSGKPLYDAARTACGPELSIVIDSSTTALLPWPVAAAGVAEVDADGVEAAEAVLAG